MIRTKGIPSEFPVSKSKLGAFRQCVVDNHLDTKLFRVHKPSGNVFVKLRWELLVQFGTKTQLRQFDKMRTKYVNDLLHRHCMPFIDCQTKIIGSRSPKSNVDINMTCPKHMEQVLHGIFDEHQKNFPGVSLEELFDTNIYGSVFHFLDERCDADQLQDMTQTCYPRYEPGVRQRMWSFTRIVEMCESYLDRRERKLLLESWPSPYQRLYRVAKSKLMPRVKKATASLSDAEGAYIKAIDTYLTELGKPKPDPHRLSEAFSRSKILEHDTYRSIGAVLHIVEKPRFIRSSSLYDSVYDNLGGVCQCLLKRTLCGTHALDARLIKSAKYVERIHDAVLRIRGSRDAVESDFNELADLSAEINVKRKALVPVEQIRPLLIRARALLSIPDNSTPFQALVAISNVVFLTLKRDAALQRVS